MQARRGCMRRRIIVAACPAIARMQALAMRAASRGGAGALLNDVLLPNRGACIPGAVEPVATRHGRGRRMADGMEHQRPGTLDRSDRLAAEKGPAGVAGWRLSSSSPSWPC